MQPPVSDKDRVWHQKEFPKLPVLKVLKRPEGETTRQFPVCRTVAVEWGLPYCPCEVSLCALCSYCDILSSSNKKMIFCKHHIGNGSCYNNLLFGSGLCILLNYVPGFSLTSYKRRWSAFTIYIHVQQCFFYWHCQNPKEHCDFWMCQPLHSTY